MYSDWKENAAAGKQSESHSSDLINESTALLSESGDENTVSVSSGVGLPASVFRLHADEEGGIFNQDLHVVVGNPRKHTEGFSTYVVYQITVKTTREKYPQEEYKINRRYNDFVWLKQKLTELYETCIIPPLPNKHGLFEHFDRYSQQFITFRIVALNRFLNRIIRHPVLTFSEPLKTFLTASTADFVVQQKDTSNILDKVSDGLFSLTVLNAARNRCSEFDSVKKYLYTFGDKLSIFDRVMHRIKKERKELVFETRQLSSEFDRWASYETALSPSLSAVMDALRAIGTSQEQRLIKPLDSVVFQPVKEYMLYVDSVKELLVRRDTIQALYKLSLHEVEKIKADKHLTSESREGSNSSWTDSYRQEEKFGNISSIAPKLICVAETNHDRLQVANEDLKSDFERWSIEKSYDMKKILLALSEQYIQYYKETLSTWEEASKKVSCPLNNNVPQ